MKVMLTGRNQITIPKPKVDELGLELGKYYEMIIDKDKIVIDITRSYDNPDDTKIISKDDKLCALETVKPIKAEKSNKVRIKSNLEESKTFTRRVISECGLLVRTKRSYLNKACEECKGTLAKEYGVKDHPCKYNKTIDNKENSFRQDVTSVKNIINNIKNNTKVLNNQITNEINTIIKKSKGRPKKQIEHTDDSVLEVFTSKDYHRCKICTEYYNNGFLIDDEFYCTKCAAKDFKKYIEKRKEE